MKNTYVCNLCGREVFVNGSLADSYKNHWEAATRAVGDSSWPKGQRHTRRKNSPSSGSGIRFSS